MTNRTPFSFGGWLLITAIYVGVMSIIVPMIDRKWWQIVLVIFASAVMYFWVLYDFFKIPVKTSELAQRLVRRRQAKQSTLKEG